MTLIEVLFIAILGFAIGIASGINTTDEPKHIQILGIITACLISYPILLVIKILV